MKTGCSTSVEMCNDPNTTMKQRREKKVNWIDKVAEDNRNGEVYGQKSMGTFGKEDVYFLEKWAIGSQRGLGSQSGE